MKRVWGRIPRIHFSTHILQGDELLIEHEKNIISWIAFLELAKWDF